MANKAHRAYPMNCAERIGHDWRVFCRECGDNRPREIERAERRSDAVKVAEAHNKGTR